MILLGAGDEGKAAVAKVAQMGDKLEEGRLVVDRHLADAAASPIPVEQDGREVKFL